MHSTPAADIRSNSRKYDKECRSVITGIGSKNRGHSTRGKSQGLEVGYTSRKISLESKLPSPINKTLSLSCKKTLEDQLLTSGLRSSKIELHKPQADKKLQEYCAVKKYGYSARASRNLRTPQHCNSRSASSLRKFDSTTDSTIRALFFHHLHFIIPTLPRGFNFGMGQTLSEPVTKKESSSDENHSLKVGASCMQGWRINMEDEHVHKLCFNDEKDSHFFAVFDGHGGQGAAQYASKKLESAIINHSAYRRGDLVTACKGGFLAVDEAWSRESVGKDESSGCTAVAVILKGNKLHCANAGDSRAVASVRGHAQLLSFDHKPNHEREMRRINAAGGFVEYNRVNGNLALSRALGDFVFKKNEQRSAEEQIVTADPDVIVKDVTKDHEFVVLACDGIWDVMTNQDVVEFVRERLSKKMEPNLVCEELMNHCLATECAVGGVGCDNMTVVLVAFKENGSFDELCRKCAVPKRDPIPPTCLISSYPDYVKGGISCL